MFKDLRIVKILRGTIVFLMVFALVFSPFTNLVVPYLPKSIKKVIKFTQVRTAKATPEGPNSPGTDAGAASGSCTNAVNWGGTGSPGGTSADDTTYVTIAGNNFDTAELTDELQISNFGFALANPTSIDGITVEIIGFTTQGGADYTTVSLFTSPGSNRGDNKATGALPTSDPGTTYTSFGSSADDWFTTGSWTEAEIESSGFGVALCFTASADNTRINIDHIRITVEYTAPAAADLSWDTGAADFEIWAGATATTDAVNTWDNGTLICSTSLTDDNSRQSTCGALNKNQKYRVQNVLKNIGGTAASMAAGDFVDQVNVKTFWAGTSPTISAATDCGFNDFGADDTSATCNVVFNGNDVRITNTGTEVLLAATTGTEGFMYLITTDSNVSLSDSSTYMNASIDTITEDSSRVTIGLKRVPGIFIRGLLKIRGLVKFR